MIVLSALFTYPLKSARALPLTRATVEPLGLEHDRRWLATRPDGSFITAREVPALLRVRALPVEGGLQLSAEGMPDLHVPIPPEDAPRVEVTIWRDRCSAARVGGEAERWLGAFLGQPVLLVYVDHRMERPVNPRYAAPDDRVGFADGYPVNVLSRASVDELNRRLDRPVTLGHFRPNLVVDGCEPFAEDGWKRIRVGAVELQVAKPCVRCMIITLEPETGERVPHGEPLRTLATFRRDGQDVLFGQNLLVRRPGVLEVGAPVELLA